MTSVAVIRDPSDRDYIILWTVDKSEQLAKDRRHIEDSRTSKPFVDQNIIPVAIRKPSGLACVIQNNEVKPEERYVTVYGITKYNEGQKVLNTIAMVSPGPPYTPIDDDYAKADPGPTYNAVAAAGGDYYQYAGVYFIKDPQGQERLPIVIEYTFEKTMFKERNEWPDMTADPSSALAACVNPFDNDDRVVIFQYYKSYHISYYWTKSRQVKYIESSNNALYATPLAATAHVTTGRNFDLYVYYVDNEYALCRAIYSGSDNEGKFAAAERILPPISVDATAGLGAVSIDDPGLEKVYVYYKPAGSESDSAYVDFQDKFEKSPPT